jgi:hypothetical protein
VTLLTTTYYEKYLLFIIMTTDKTQFLYKDSNDKVPKNVIAVSIQQQVTEIPNEFCFGCLSLTRVEIPNTVTTIQYGAFAECSSLTTIDIPDTVTTIQSGAFYRCSSLTAVDLPNTVTTIRDGTFFGCSSLITVDIPNTVTTIEYAAFCECPSLISIAIPESVSCILDHAFSECDALEQRQVNGCNYHQDINTWLRQRFDNLPLHQTCYNDTSTLNTTTFNNLIQHHASTLTVNDAMLMTPLHILCCNPTATIEMIKQLQAAEPQAASMENVMNKTPLMILLECKSMKYNVLHENGQLLPVVGLLEQGLDCDAFEAIRAFSGSNRVLVSELENKDAATGLLPFMYGALLSKCGLDIVYELAMERVDLLV